MTFQNGEASSASQHGAEGQLLRLLLKLDSIPNQAAALQLALDAITAAIPCDEAFFYEWSEQAGQAQVAHSASTHARLFNDYLNEHRTIDPCASEAMRQRCLVGSACLTLEDAVGNGTLDDLSFTTHFLNRNGGLRHVLFHHANLIGTQRTSLHLFRRADRPAFSRTERACLDLFHLHLIGRLRQQCAHDQARHERDALQCSLNLLHRPVFLLDAYARTVACNSAASALAREGTRVRLAGDHLLPGQECDHASWIPAAIKKLLATDARRHPTESYLQPLHGARSGPTRHFGLLVRLHGGHDCGVAVVYLILIDTEQAAACHRPDELSRALGFTRSEARVADALIAGLGTEEIAEVFDIRRDTVRSHIKRLLAKTGTRGNAELQKLLLRIAPPYIPLQRQSAPAPRRKRANGN